MTVRPESANRARRNEYRQIQADIARGLVPLPQCEDVGFVVEVIRRRATVTDGCWLWDGHDRTGNYGMLGLSPVSRRNRLWAAHRASWWVRHLRPIPTGMDVCHTCDNPTCSNPDHLFLGTHTDNMQDLRRKIKFGLRPSIPRSLPGLMIRRLKDGRLKIWRNGVIEYRALARPDVALDAEPPESNS